MTGELRGVPGPPGVLAEGWGCGGFHSGSVDEADLEIT